MVGLWSLKQSVWFKNPSRWNVSIEILSERFLLNMGERFLDLSKELKNVRTIELVCKNSFFLERLFWAILGVLGIAWAFYFVPHNFQVWNNNPSIKMQGDLDLSQIRYPSISITPSGTTKYAKVPKCWKSEMYTDN